MATELQDVIAKLDAESLRGLVLIHCPPSAIVEAWAAQLKGEGQ